MRHQGSPEQHEIPQKIQHLVPDTLVGKAKSLGVAHPGFVENHRIFQRAPQGEPPPTQGIHLGEKAEGPSSFEGGTN
jgi:hypothetical protein